MDDLDEELSTWGRKWRDRQAPLGASALKIGSKVRTPRLTQFGSIVSTVFGASILVAALVFGGARGDLTATATDVPGVGTQRAAVDTQTGAPSPPARVHDGDAVEAQGQLVFRSDESPVLCARALTNETSSGCLEPFVVVLGLGPDEVPGYNGEDSWTSPMMLIRGVWREGVISDGTFVRVMDRPDLGRPDAPCSPPDAGWAMNVDAGAQNEAATRLQALVELDPERYAQPWLARSPGGARVLVVGTVGDVADVQQALSEAYPFNLCVIKVSFSDRRLNEVAATLQLPGRTSASVDPVRNRVVVSTVVFDDGLAETVAPFGATVEIAPLVTAQST